MVRSNMKILTQFLNIGKKIEEGKPLEDFFTEQFNDIVNSWLFLKLDFDNFNVNAALANSEFDENFKNFLAKANKKKSLKLYFEHIKGEVENEETKKKYAAERKLLKDNAANITKLTLKNTCDFTKIIDTSIDYPKLKQLIYENGRVQESEFQIQKKMENLEKLTIKYSPNFQIYIMERLPAKLKELYLEKLNLINDDLENLIKRIFS